MSLALRKCFESRAPENKVFRTTFGLKTEQITADTKKKMLMTKFGIVTRRKLLYSGQYKENEMGTIFSTNGREETYITL
jgi:hypothetical protein